MLKLLTLGMFAFASVASAHPSTFEMTCAQAKGLVKSRGRVVLNYEIARNGNLYSDTFVSEPAYCWGHYEAIPHSVRTLDKRSCWIGYTCRYNGHP